MDGDIPIPRGHEEVRIAIYYFCASEFGWDKKTVDSQPVDYLKQLMNYHMKLHEDKKNIKIPKKYKKNF